MQKPSQSDFQTENQEKNWTLYVHGSTKGTGDYIEYILPQDFAGTTRRFMGDAATNFDPRNQEGDWIKLSKLQYKRELERRDEQRRAYRDAMTAWEVQRDADLQAAYDAALSISEGPVRSQFSNTKDFEAAYEVHSVYIAGQIALFRDGEKALNLATADALNFDSRAGYKLMHEGKEIALLGRNRETAMMTVLLIGDSGLPLERKDYPFSQVVQIHQRENNWQFEWRDYTVLGSYYSLEIISGYNRHICAQLELKADGIFLKVNASTHDLAEASELVAIHSYLFSIASKWEAKLAQERLEAEATQA